MKSNFFNSSSILRKFLIFNFIVFLFLGTFTFFYLDAIEPNLVENRSKQHTRIINNTSDHIQRLNIEFSKEGVTKFLLSTRFLFQNLDRVEFYDLNFDLLGDTDTLDLVQDAFVKSDNVEESKIGNNDDQDINLDKTPKTKQKISFNTKSYVRKYYEEKNKKEQLIISETINNNFYVITANPVVIDNENKGYIIVSEIADDILLAVDERKNFILRTVFSIALVIFIFSVFLNKYILKPI